MVATERVWVLGHVAALVAAAAIVAANGGTYLLARRVLARLRRGNQHGTVFEALATAYAAGAVLRGVAHLAAAAASLISLTEGTAFVRQLPQESAWSYLFPVMVAYNLMALAIGGLTALAHRNTIRLLRETGPPRG